VLHRVRPECSVVESLRRDSRLTCQSQVRQTHTTHATQGNIFADVEEGVPIHLAVNTIHILKDNSLFFCLFPSGCLEINDMMGNVGKKALALGDNIFHAVLLVF